MLLDFNYYNPTRIYFGKTALQNLRGELDAYGDTVLLVYGRGSVKKIGLYDEVVSILKAAGKKIIELDGVKSNPTYERMTEGCRLVRETTYRLFWPWAEDRSLTARKPFPFRLTARAIPGSAIG